MAGDRRACTVVDSVFQYGESDKRVWTTGQLGLILHTDTILKHTALSRYQAGT